MKNGQEYTCEYNKITGETYMNDHEMEYSFTNSTAVLEEDVVVNDTKVDLYAVDPWTPITILEEQYIDFAPLINGAGTIAAIATQIYSAMIGRTASYLIEQLAKATLKRHWAVIADYCGDALLDLIGVNASKIVNVTFSYDMQMTSGLVDLMGSSVKVTAYRYANYTGIIKLLGYTFSKGTGEHGGWWSSSKPYGLDQPIEEY